MRTRVALSTLTPEEVEVARRWAFFNAWGWPSDVTRPQDPQDRKQVADAYLAFAQHAIGIDKCLAYWNSPEFMAILPVRTEWS